MRVSTALRCLFFLFGTKLRIRHDCCKQAVQLKTLPGRSNEFDRDGGTTAERFEKSLVPEGGHASLARGKPTRSTKVGQLALGWAP